MKNLFVGILYGDIVKNIDEEDVFALNLNDKLVYIWGKTDFTSSKDLVEFFGKKYFQNLRQYDVSIVTEDKIFVNDEKLNRLKDSKNLKYVQIRYVGKEFDELVKQWKDRAFCIREAETVFGIRTVKIDLFE